MSDLSGAEAAAEGEVEGESLELNLRLDQDGRTTYDPALAADGEEDDERDAKRAKLKHDTSSSSTTSATTTPTSSSLDYSSKSVMTNLANLGVDGKDTTMSKQLDELLFDCEITDSGLLPRTFWISANNDSSPRCFLEKMALEIFHHHVPSSGYYYDPKTSGAEWWVQIRPSPPAGRYSMHASSGTGDGDGDANNDDNDLAKSGISFHWDKDEDFRLLTGGSMYIHPHVSTVTYLTDLGAPTMVLSKRVDPMSGSYITDVDDDGNVSDVEGLVSFPRQGKHLSFDGRYLHAAPSDLLKDGLFEQQCSFERSDNMDKKELKVLERRHRRVTFLVNVWLNYKPFNVNPFPDTMISNLSKVDLLGDFDLFDKCEEEKKVLNQTITAKLNEDAKITREDGSADDENTCVANKNWPMGSCSDESIKVPMPVDLIRSCRAGDDVKVIWKGKDVKLSGTNA
jgi:hypothetical protein